MVARYLLSRSAASAWRARVRSSARNRLSFRNSRAAPCGRKRGQGHEAVADRQSAHLGFAGNLLLQAARFRTLPVDVIIAALHVAVLLKARVERLDGFTLAGVQLQRRVHGRGGSRVRSDDSRANQQRALRHVAAAGSLGESDYRVAARG